MNFLLWIIFGGIAGWLASIIVGTNPQMGILANIVVGIIGAFLGGWIADMISGRSGKPKSERPTSVWGFIWAVIGAIILLVILNLIF
jgi:uncharacterized membrane protein YeaQ/YmgE (transglycosylase-associated protein family)